MGTIRAEDEGGAELHSVEAPDADHASRAVPEELRRTKARMKPDSQFASALDEQLVEVLPEENDRRRVGRKKKFLPAWGHDADPVDGVRPRAHLLADAEGLGQLKRRWGESRAAGLVAREPASVDKNDVGHATLSQGNRCRRAGRSSPDDTREFIPSLLGRSRRPWGRFLATKSTARDLRRTQELRNRVPSARG